MFDKNFKIKVSGNWCEYQPNKHIDLREIISFECWADQLGNPYRFHLKNGSYHYIERYEIGKQIENVLKEQQAKVEELQKQINSALEQIGKLYIKAEIDYEKERNPYYDGMLSALDLAEQAIRGELEEQALKGEG
ncbi:hypothetical protein [Acinetobacter baumannii]|uniref:hypothetical protein n=1 Tax=Acinetobacter baumannii TaxID=470 RepID=UPI00144136AD|nr:hypothetical protein [Acinetobacter baumannii]MBH8377583.1 hypothetical protein [Acinetobacter baumannii]MDC4112921.1 hypothetical protein [Acinetobacter baumannii]NKN75651.1 hypothetical protein [Acinetobacter baumannii]